MAEEPEFRCQICGSSEQGCHGPTSSEKVVISGVIDRKVPQKPPRPRVPLQRTRFGVAGYIGDVEVYDRNHPNLKLLGGDDLKSEVEAPKRKIKKKKEGVDG